MILMKTRKNHFAGSKELYNESTFHEVEVEKVSKEVGISSQKGWKHKQT